MAFWHIGPLKGEFQPEEFTETQETDVEYKTPVGGVQRAIVKGWEPREITISFTVDNLARSEPAPADGGTDDIVDPTVGDLSPKKRIDPEEVWKMIQKMQRPANGHPRSIAKVPVYIPGWGNGGRNEPVLAFITSSSIQRTHISGRGQITDRAGRPIPSNGDEQKIQAVKAIITVTLKEAAKIRRG